MIVIEASSSLLKVAKSSKLRPLSMNSIFAVLGLILPSFKATILNTSFPELNFTDNTFFVLETK